MPYDGSIARELGAVNRHLVAGAITAALLLFGVVGWAATAVVEGAILASGTVVSEGARKRVQHRFGGSVAEIRISNGDRVSAGNVLFRLDGTEVAAELAIIRTKMMELRVRRHRLISERDELPWRSLPRELLDEIQPIETSAALVQGQQKLFASRLALRKARKAQLEERILQYESELEGLAALLKSRTGELEILEEETANLRALRKKDLVPAARFNVIQRSMIEMQGRVAESMSELARTRGKISETRLQIIELADNFQSEVLEEIDKIAAELSELVEKHRADQDRYDRLDITASIDGFVHELQVNTIGGVVASGDTLAYLVPEDDELVVDGKIQTTDRDQVSVGMPVRIRFTAFNQRTTPEAIGTVTRIGSDQSVDEDGSAPYYKVRVVLNKDAVDQEASLDIRPGMPAELIVTSEARTVVSYLIKPLADQLQRVFRES